MGAPTIRHRRKGATYEQSAQRVGYTVMFLRMTETEVRELAENTPDIGRELQHIADALNAEANDLAKHVSE